MAWTVKNNNLTMAEGDYGVALPIEITGMEFGASDCVQIVIKRETNGETILTKQFTNIQNNTVNLEFTEEETALLPVGSYVYRMDAYQNDNYLNNIIPSATIKVVDVA